MTEVTEDELPIKATRRICFVQADNALTHHGLRAGEESRVKLARAIGAAFQRASVTIAELATGAVGSTAVPTLPRDRSMASPISDETRHSATSKPAGDRHAVDPSRLSMTGLFDA